MSTKNLYPEVRYLHNLCKVDNYKDRYRPFGLPRSLSADELTLLAPLPGGDVVVSHRDGLAQFEPETRCTMAITTRQCDCACVCADNKVVALSKHGPLFLERMPGGRLSVLQDIAPLWNGVSITAEPMAAVSLIVDSITLGEAYSPGDVVTEGDRRRIGSAVKSAYEDLHARAVEQGVFLSATVSTFRTASRHVTVRRHRGLWFTGAWGISVTRGIGQATWRPRPTMCRALGRLSRQ